MSPCQWGRALSRLKSRSSSAGKLLRQKGSLPRLSEEARNVCTESRVSSTLSFLLQVEDLPLRSATPYPQCIRGPVSYPRKLLKRVISLCAALCICTFTLHSWQDSTCRCTSVMSDLLSQSVSGLRPGDCSTRASSSASSRCLSEGRVKTTSPYQYDSAGRNPF